MSRMGTSWICFVVALSSIVGVVRSSRSATCQLMRNPMLEDPEKQLAETITGTVTFSQSAKYAPVSVTLDVYGFKDESKNKSLGFHIHADTDDSDGCNSMGGHFNPGNKTHGAPTDTERHVGDLGNIVPDENGNVKVTIEDSMISLGDDDNSIKEKSVVIHAGKDDLGKGGDVGSEKTGNAGKRLACCLIKLGVSGSAATWPSYITLTLALMAVLARAG